LSNNDENHFQIAKSRLDSLDEAFQRTLCDKINWRLLPHTEPKALYEDFYEHMKKQSHNLDCGCCGCISHSFDEICKLPLTDPDLSNKLRMGMGMKTSVGAVEHPRVLEREVRTLSCHVGVGTIELLHSGQRWPTSRRASRLGSIARLIPGRHDKGRSRTRGWARHLARGEWCPPTVRTNKGVGTSRLPLVTLACFPRRSLFEGM
jgi:hypothetical protein